MTWTEKKRKDGYYRATRVSTWWGESRDATYLRLWTTADITKNPSRFAFFRANGYLPQSPYWNYYREINSLYLGSQTATFSAPYSPGSVTVTDDHFTTSGAGISGTQTLPSTDFLWTDMRNRAIAQANSKVREQYTGLGETLAELNKTAAMCVNTIHRVVRAARAVRKGRFKQAAQALAMDVPKGASTSKAFADNWLQYRYGWLPLYSTVYGTMVAHFELTRSRPIVHHARGRATNDVWRSTTYQNYDGSNAGTITGLSQVPFRTKKRIMRDCSCEVTYIYKITNPTLAAANSLGLADPATLAWELIPFSFVVDWFSNVGDVIEQLGAFTGKQFLSGSISYLERTTIICTSEYTGGPIAGVKTSFSPAYCESKHVHLRREALTTQPTFGLHLNNGLSLKRLTDGVSLLRQVFR